MNETPQPDIVCPKCGERHDPGDYPDHWKDGGTFWFQCANCEAKFEVRVEFDPVFWTTGEIAGPK